jgi:ATP-dependent DNA ligase
MFVGEELISFENRTYHCTCKAFNGVKCPHLKGFIFESKPLPVVVEPEPEIWRSSRAKRGEINYNEKRIEEAKNDNAFQGVMLASKYDGTQKINNWIMSEKLDGLRAIWNGETLVSRNGNLFYPPEFFIKDFPKGVVLDGELFLGRGMFQKCMSITRRQDGNDEWKDITYLVFDGPNIEGNFSTRLKMLQWMLEKCKSPYVKMHEH